MAERDSPLHSRMITLPAEEICAERLHDRLKDIELTLVGLTNPNKVFEFDERALELPLQELTRVRKAFGNFLGLHG